MGDLSRRRAAKAGGAEWQQGSCLAPNVARRTFARRWGDMGRQPVAAPRVHPAGEKASDASVACPRNDDDGATPTLGVHS